MELDSSGFGDYTRQGTIENVKVAKDFPMHSWEQSFSNPSASTAYGMMEPPDLSKFGRSEQLHAALFGIEKFVIKNDRYPSNNDEDRKECLDFAQKTMDDNKDGH